MSQTVSIAEARNNFPALVRQVVEQNDLVVVTSRNQPQVVLVHWETYQQLQELQAEGAEQRLRVLVDDMLILLSTLREAYQPGSYELIQGTQELIDLAKQAWTTCRLLDTPRRHLASTIADGLLFMHQSNQEITVQQISQLQQLLPLLHETDLTKEDVASADQNLIIVGLDGMVSMDDALVDSYEKPKA